MFSERELVSGYFIAFARIQEIEKIGQSSGGIVIAVKLTALIFCDLL